MLFNSSVFIFAYLPLALLGFFLAARLSNALALAWLTLASIVFYGWWNPAWVPLMLASIAVNFAAARTIFARLADAAAARRMLAAAIAVDLTVLVYYKYAGFFVETLSLLAGTSWRWSAGELPLGISFFTFTQIAFLVDVYRRKTVDFSPVRYGLFVTYFPHLIAGPILHHAEMMPQFERADIFRFSADRLADGLVMFILGLFKKVVLADAFGGYASPAFDAAATHALTLFEAWGAALSYTLQIYFDFSGYSDMAIGLAMMIGVRLPENFNSPYKAHNIAEFWRRWHMTLSRFLRDYLYIPLGGNRRGPARHQVNLMLTMLLGGLWHGAGWTFVVWGGLHGLYLMAFHAWRRAADAARLHVRRMPMSLVTTPMAWATTFLAVVIAWVFFRSSDLASAASMLRGMAGRNGAQLPEQIISFVPALGAVAQGVGKVAYLADGSVMGFVEMLVMLGLGLGLALFAPNLPQLRTRQRYLLVVPCAALTLQRVVWGTSSAFLYFQF